MTGRQAALLPLQRRAPEAPRRPQSLRVCVTAGLVTVGRADVGGPVLHRRVVDMAVHHHCPGSAWPCASVLWCQ